MSEIASERELEGPQASASARILHISDLHTGRSGPSNVSGALRELISELTPEVLVVTGDLTHRGRRDELQKARDLLDGLGLRFIAVPGNHDLPYVVPRRFTQTRADWERVFGDSEPRYVSDRLAILGLNSTRPLLHQGGSLKSSQLDRLDSRFAAAPVDALRTVALHHHLAAPPWRVARKRPVRRRDVVLRQLANAGVELVLSGHVHQASFAQRREFEVVTRDQGSSIVLATVPGFGRPRPSRPGEAVGFNLYVVDQMTITVVTYSWEVDTFVGGGRRTFGRAMRQQPRQTG